MSGALRAALLGAPARGTLDLGPAGRVEATPLVPDNVDSDLEAVLASRLLLRAWSDSTWPDDDFDRADDLVDLVRHDEEHRRGDALTYHLGRADGSTVGCLYLLPTALACATRGLTPPRPDASDDAGPGALPGPDDLVVRGWLRTPLDQRPLVPATMAWLRVVFPTVRRWWQCPASFVGQLAGCDDAGLDRRWTCDGWEFRTGR